MYRRKLLEQKSLHNDYLTYIKTTMFEKSYETEELAERLVQLSKKLGAEIRLTEKELDELELVAMLHDIGNISIDKDILIKTEKLTEDEEIIRNKGTQFDPLLADIFITRVLAEK